MIDRLEKLIFQVSMVANISDENFGTSSGISLKYKLQAMSNLAKTKERKFEAGMQQRYRLIFSNPVIPEIKPDAWTNIKYTFTRNFPANVAEEADTAIKLEGIVSKETQLGVLSIVDNVDVEIEKLEEEQAEMEVDAVMKGMFGNQKQSDAGGAIADDTVDHIKSLNGAQTQSLIAIMSQYTSGSLTEGQAVNLISTAIGVSKEQARQILNGEL